MIGVYLTDMEHLSDHRYIAARFGRSMSPRLRSIRDDQPRWAIKKLNEDRLMVSIIADSWSHPVPDDDIIIEAQWIRDTVTRACNAAMPKVRLVPADPCIGGRRKLRNYVA